MRAAVSGQISQGIFLGGELLSRCVGFCLFLQLIFLLAGLYIEIISICSRLSHSSDRAACLAVLASLAQTKSRFALQWFRCGDTEASRQLPLRQRGSASTTAAAATATARHASRHQRILCLVSVWLSSIRKRVRSCIRRR
jgi:hypothetical protein